jgi:hypothetical protein
MSVRIVRGPLRVLHEQRLRRPELLLRHAQPRQIQQNFIARGRGVLKWRKNALRRRDISTVQRFRCSFRRRARLGARTSGQQAQARQRSPHGSATFKI